MRLCVEKNKKQKTKNTKQLQAAGVYGKNQFAYTTGRDARDAIALLVLRWIHGWSLKLIWAIYCSDVSGAFDKVSTDILMDKLRRLNIHPKILAVLESWLQARKAKVIVDGESSFEFWLREMVYQGTVWGPPLWNIHFSDARQAIRASGFKEVVFADDLNAYKSFPANTPEETLRAEMQSCQAELHQWGSGNQVQFDAAKESMHILAPFSRGSNDEFKLLGLIFDSSLTMQSELHHLVGNVRWKNQTILRCQRFFGIYDLINVYKSQVLSYIEYRTPGVYHACSTHLDRLDGTQTRFLEALGLSEKDALQSFGLAPLRLRRDIAMLGVIHRSVLGKGPPQFHELFQRADASAPTRATRQSAQRHNKQLVDVRD